MFAWLRRGWTPERVERAITGHAAMELALAAAVPPGARVRVAGRAAATEAAPLVAPISGAPCLWWRVVVEKGDGRSVVIDEDAGQDLLLVGAQPGPKALVRMAGARVAARADTQTLYGLVGDGPQGFEALLARHAFRRRGRPTMHYHEHRIEVGDALEVLGHATAEPDPDPASAASYRAHATRVVLAGLRKLPLLVRDAPAERVQ